MYPYSILHLLADQPRVSGMVQKSYTGNAVQPYDNISPNSLSCINDSTAGFDQVGS
jgi:hypothetical protein